MMASTKSTHRHRWQHVSWIGPDMVGFRCRAEGCGARYERKMTPAELAFYRKNLEWKTRFKKPNIHSVFHEFTKRFQTKEEKWKWVGYDLIERVERWAEKHPNDVRLAVCDDRYYSGSRLVFIEHQTKDQYHGTTVVFLPQCSGDEPSTLFLYPSHLQVLLKLLPDIRRKAAVVQRREQRKSVAVNKAWRKILTLPVGNPPGVEESE